MKLRDLPAEGLEPAGPFVFQADIEFARDPGGATGVCRQRVGYPFHLGRTLMMPGDPALAIDWPVTPDEAVTSDRDRTLPVLADLAAQAF